MLPRGNLRSSLTVPNLRAPSDLDAVDMAKRRIPDGYRFVKLVRVLQTGPTAMQTWAVDLIVEKLA